MFSLLPWQWTESIYDLTGKDLYRAGIRLLLADLDNTLIPYSRSEPDEALRCWLADLNANGVTLFLLSNSRKAVRAPHFAQALGIDYLCHAGKPKTGGYRAAMERCGVAPGKPGGHPFYFGQTDLSVGKSGPVSALLGGAAHAGSGP